MSRQHVTPYLVRHGEVRKLEPVTHDFDEDWLQQFIFKYHQSIPINEIEPAFGPLIPVCRELPTRAGPIDMLFINSNGLPTLVECKLWKNPEARREVVGQILDYAKELSQWSFEDLQKAVCDAQRKADRSLYDLVIHDPEEVDERDFIDSVARNLRRGRFLLLIIGDGIRESVEQIAEFLQKYGHLNFSFALIEFGVFKLPDSDDGEYFIQPRVLTQTVEIERAVFRIEDGTITADAPALGKVSPTPKRAKISEQVFFENLKADTEIKDQLKAFFVRAQGIGVDVEPGSDSMIMRSNLFDVNLGVFKVSDQFRNRGIASTTQEMGQPQIGEEYLAQLANLLPNGFVKHAENRFYWRVMVRENKRERYPTVSEMMAIQDKWFELIQETLDKIAKSDSSRAER